MFGGVSGSSLCLLEEWLAIGRWLLLGGYPLAACAQDFAVSSFVDQVARSDQGQSDFDQRLRRTQENRIFGETIEETAHSPSNWLSRCLSSSLSVKANRS